MIINQSSIYTNIKVLLNILLKIILVEIIYSNSRFNYGGDYFRLHDIQAIRMLSTASFAIGAAGIALGTVGLLLGGDDEAVAVLVQPGHIALRGSF